MIALFVFLVIVVLLGFRATMTTGTAGLADEMKTFYDRALLERALPLLVWQQFGQRRPIPRNGGKTIEFRRFTALAAATTPLTEGTTPAGNALEAAASTATVAQYGDFIQGSDLLELTTIDPILLETAQLLGEQAGLTLDTMARTTLVAGTAVQRAGGRLTRNTITSLDILTTDEVRKAVRTLKRAHARPLADGSFVAVIEAGAAYDLQDDILWQDANKYAGTKALFTGEIGTIFGVRFVESDNHKVYTGEGAAGIDVYCTVIFGANAYGTIPLEGGNLEFIFKPKGSAGSADPLEQRWTSGWKVTETWKILNDAFMLRIEHAVSA